MSRNFTVRLKPSHEAHRAKWQCLWFFEVFFLLSHQKSLYRFYRIYGIILIILGLDLISFLNKYCSFYSQSTCTNSNINPTRKAYHRYKQKLMHTICTIHRTINYNKQIFYVCNWFYLFKRGFNIHTSFFCVGVFDGMLFVVMVIYATIWCTYINTLRASMVRMI